MLGQSEGKGGVMGMRVTKEGFTEGVRPVPSLRAVQTVGRWRMCQTGVQCKGRQREEECGVL